MDLSRAFGATVRRLRLEKGLTQEQLGLSADLRRTYISILELGQQTPSLATVFKLALALDVKPSTLIEQTEQAIDASFASSAERSS